MEKGQVSFDILLTAIALIAFLGMIAVFTSFLESNGTAGSVRAQERQILLEVSGIVANSRILADSANGSKITFLVPKILVPEKKENTGCELSFDTSKNKATISKVVGKATITEEKSMAFHQSLLYKAAPCGESIRIEKVG